MYLHERLNYLFHTETELLRGNSHVQPYLSTWNTINTIQLQSYLHIVFVIKYMKAIIHEKTQLFMSILIASFTTSFRH